MDVVRSRSDTSEMLTLVGRPPGRDAPAELSPISLRAADGHQRGRWTVRQSQIVRVIPRTAALLAHHHLHHLHQLSSRL